MDSRIKSKKLVENISFPNFNVFGIVSKINSFFAGSFSMRTVAPPSASFFVSASAEEHASSTSTHEKSLGTDAIADSLSERKQSSGVRSRLTSAQEPEEQRMALPVTNRVFSSSLRVPDSLRNTTRTPASEG